VPISLSYITPTRVEPAGGATQGKGPAAAFAPPEWARALRDSGDGEKARGYHAGVAHDLWGLGVLLLEVRKGDGRGYI
jgi:hypothetical protein